MEQSFFKTILSIPQVKEQYLLKLRIIAGIRRFFTEKLFLEIEPPLLQSALIPESYLDIFITEERRVGLEGKFSRNRYLLTSPESFSKKLLAAGFGSHFAITKSFRNGEPLSGKHLSEFSMLEWYEKGSNYLQVMETTEQLFTYLASELLDGKELNYNGHEISLVAPWKRYSVQQLFKEILNINLEATFSEELQYFDRNLLQGEVERHHLPIIFEKKTTWEEVYNQLFLTYIEPALPANIPVIIYDYPHELSPLAKPKAGETKKGNVWAERFEVMIAGLEMCDTYTENTDPELQEKTFRTEIEKIKQAQKAEYPYDWDFIEALRHGLPACSGNALGIDRVVMLLGNYKTILDVSS